MGVFTITLLSDNQKIEAPYTLSEVDIQHELNKIPYARLSFIDGNPSLREFKLSNTEFFIPGKELEIKIRYEADAKNEATLFKGVVVKHQVEADIYASFLHVELKDKAIKMTAHPKSMVFRDQEEKQVFQELIESNGLEVDTLADLPTQHAELVQYGVTDWDFLLNRADTNGLWLKCDQGKITTIDPSSINTDNDQHRMAYGLDSIYNLHLEIDAEQQVQQAESTGWDIAEQAMKETVQAADFAGGPSNLDTKTLVDAAGAENYHLQSAVPLKIEELQAWSDAKMRKSRMAMVRGSFSIQGTPTIKLLEIIKIDGVSDRFNGNAIITGLRHRISEEGWFTDVQFGLNADWYADLYPIHEKPAAGLLSAINGLQVGVVDAFLEDPEEHFRVKVKIPALGEAAEAVWARLASPDAGNERGFLLRPEPDDEVVVGFFNDDPRQAVILGAMFSQNQAPPEADQITEANPLKGFFSKEGIQLKIDDENKVLQLLTSEDQSITLDQTEELIEIKDVHGNSIKMSKDGIEIKSVKELKIEADKDVTIKGSKVDVQ